MTPELLLTMIGGLITILLALVAFIGSRVHSKLDQIPEQLNRLNTTLHKIEIELRKDLSNHDGRIRVLESESNHHGD